MESAIHALYKGCHPDLFVACNIGASKVQRMNLGCAQSVLRENARLLKLLHDYLVQSLENYSGQSAVFRFVFYVNSEENYSSCWRAAVTLPPLMTVPDSFPLPTLTRNALPRLLKAAQVQGFERGIFSKQKNSKSIRRVPSRTDSVPTSLQTLQI